jgi:hypothetical protein
MTPRYFFSKKGDDNILLLTVKNLIEAFPEDIKFHYALESYIHNESSLIDYDSYSKSYKLKYLFRESLK